MEIQIFTKNVYGNELLYPACQKAQSLVDLTGKKTFDARDLKRIEALGFTVKNVLNPNFNR